MIRKEEDLSCRWPRFFLCASGAAAEQRQWLVSRGLVGVGEVFQALQRLVGVAVGTQGEGVKAAALHEEQLVTQDGEALFQR